MKIATFNEEYNLLKKGAKNVCGVDEVGRGPLAGPVVACAAVFNFAHPDFKKLEKRVQFRDSKLYTQKMRKEIFEVLTNSLALEYSISSVSPGQIDEGNILEASVLAMRQAVSGLKTRPEFLLIDGRNTLEDYPCNQKAIIRGDEKIASIAAASVIAKVWRDREMQKYHTRWPRYGFDTHKGYGTKKHLEMIKKYGPCPIHRMSFAPFRQ